MIQSLYIHIPFCLRKCIYCDFFSVPYDESLATHYVSGLIHELRLRRDAVGSLETIYVGGGTPTSLPLKLLISMMRAVQDLFTPASTAEMTIEANPGTVTDDKMKALVDHGVNRVSIGAQSFDDLELKLLGRIHTRNDTDHAVAAARHAGIGAVSLDLIYGIPGQTMEQWLQNIASALDRSPHHLSAYELTPERGTPLFEVLAEGRLRRLPEEQLADMYDATISGLGEAGYRQYEISNFAQPGFECRHNLNYWNRGEYVGIGAGAHSFIGDKRVKNATDIGRYLSALSGGRLPVEEISEVSCEDALKEFIFLGLRKTEGVRVSTFLEDLGIDIREASRPLIAEGLLTADGDYMRLTRRGMAVSNGVIRELFMILGLV